MGAFSHVWSLELCTSKLCTVALSSCPLELLNGHVYDNTCSVCVIDHDLGYQIMSNQSVLHLGELNIVGSAELSWPKKITAFRTAYLLSHVVILSGVVRELRASSIFSHLCLVVSHLYEANQFLNFSRRLITVSFSNASPLAGLPLTNMSSNVASS